MNANAPGKVKHDPQAHLEELFENLVLEWKCVFKIEDQFFSQHMTPANDISAYSTLALLMPHNQRACMVLKLFLPRNMDKQLNPRQITVHEVLITIPAGYILTFEYQENQDVSKAGEWFVQGDGFTSRDQLFPLGSIKVTTRNCFVSCAKIPPLREAGLQDKAAAFVVTITNKPSELRFVIRELSELLSTLACKFQGKIEEERVKDPLIKWFKDSSNAAHLTMGNIVDVIDRPHIPMQRAENVFSDWKAYIVPQVYGALYESEFNALAAKKLMEPVFELKLMESSIGMNALDKPTPAQEYFKSDALIYVGFINYNETNVIRPDTGDSIAVTIIPEAAATADLIADDEPVTDASELAALDRKGKGPALPDNEDADSTTSEKRCDEELRIETEKDDYQDKDPYTWHATVIDSTEVTPSGYLTIILRHRQDPTLVGPRAGRPFVTLTLDTVNSRGASLSEIIKRISIVPSIQIKLSITTNNLELKDQVRCSDQLWFNNTDQQKRICKALLSHDPDNSPLARVNILSLKGTSTLSLTDDFDTAQKAAYDSMKETPEITLIHGPFGTGKTELVLAIMAEIISNPGIKRRVMYVIDNNSGADDAALRFSSLCRDKNLKKIIIRCHALTTEEDQFYKCFDQVKAPLSHNYEIPDELITEFSTIAFLRHISNKVQAHKECSDSRFVLGGMSLAQAMYEKIQTADYSNLQSVKDYLQSFGKDGFQSTYQDIRTAIKIALKKLMVITLHDADVIMCTLAAAAKVNLASNFLPDIVVLDEGSRVSEIKTVTLFGSYNPTAFIIAADHQQMRTYCASASQSKARIPCLNPFGQQYLLSAFERFINVGWEHCFLSVQHRCKGDIPGWLSNTFYHGRLLRANPTESERDILQSMRTFAKDTLGVPSRANRYMVNIRGSSHCKEDGGTSSYNIHEIDEICSDIEHMMKDQKFKDKSILVLSFYKAQVAKLRVALREYPSVRCQTVTSIQGGAADVVLLSFVTTLSTQFINEPHRLLVACSRAKWLFGMYSTCELSKGKSNNENRYIKSLFSSLKAKNQIVDRFAY